VPHHAKNTKVRRDEAMIEGLLGHAQRLGHVSLGKGPNVKPAAVAALYRKHLEALRRADELEAAWKTALLVERRLEAELKPTHAQVQRYVLAFFDDDVAALKLFDMKPRKQPVVSVETKQRAVEKRRETRRLRGTMGKRQRKKAKAKG
jgi:hypothetical protein